jgi:uncharacterized membrane protein
MGATGNDFWVIYAVVSMAAVVLLVAGVGVALIMGGRIYDAVKVARNRRLLRMADIDPDTVGPGSRSNT